jgi:hypothetical protein
LGATGDQVKVFAPPPLSVVAPPVQTAEFVAAAVTTGSGFTVTDTEAIFVLAQPESVFVPLTV